MTSHVLVRLVSLAVAAPLVLAACTATQDPGEAVTPDSQAGSGTDEAADTGQAPVEELTSPLDPYLDVLYGRRADDDVLRDFLATEESVAACMAAEGFEYTPRGEAYLEAERTFATQGTEAERATRDWVAQNGYGMNASQAQAQADLEAADPQADYVDGLSEADQQAYYLALWGDQNSGGSGTGCIGAASGGEEPPSLSQRWEPLVASLEQMWGQLIPSDPAAVEADRAWSDCMADAGFPGVATPADAPLLAAPPESNGPAAAAVEGDPEALQHEITVALADFDCRTETDYDARMRAVQVAAETVFLEQNRAQLETLLAESEQGQ